MLRIDAHQHFWIFNPVRDSWINDEMKLIQRDFLPADLEPVLKKNGIDGSVIVQSDQSPAENEFQLKNANGNDFIKGVVGWVDLQAADIELQLEQLSLHKKLKGFRHVLQAEPDPAFMLRPEFMRGISFLSKFDFTYDILVFPSHLKNASQLVQAFPGQHFVIDHLAKPLIKAQLIKEWQQDMMAIAKHENVSCKISGMVTEADWKKMDAGRFQALS